MKFFASFLVLATLSSASFAQSLVKSCAFDYVDEEAGASSNVFEIKKSTKGYSGTMITSMGGETSRTEAPVTVKDYSIRAGLSYDADASDELFSEFNHGEMLIMHAMALTGDIDMGDEDEDMGPNPFSAGLDLTKVRFVRVFEAVGEADDIGSAAIIEAKDEKGKDLGSFLGGFLVLPCK